MITSERTEALTARDSDRWMEVLEEIGSCDSYHLPAYHRLAEAQGEGKAAMLVFREGACTIAFPMLVRDVELPGVVGKDAGLKDATSVYGYPGPISSTRAIPPEIKQRFALALHDFLAQHRIICAFSRLNPILDNAHILRGYGETADIGPTVSIDLLPPRDTQYALYRRSHRHDIERLQEAGFRCSEAGREALPGFIGAYDETMRRNDAEDYYYFSPDYFDRLLAEMPGTARLFVCRHGGVVASGIIALATNGIVQGHLGGSLNQYVRMAPMKMVYDAVRIWANDTGASIFHLGGGIGGRKDGLLFHKRGFGKQEHIFSVWSCYVDEQTCDALYSEACRAAGVAPNQSYFPPYRNPVLWADQRLGSPGL